MHRKNQIYKSLLVLGAIVLMMNYAAFANRNLDPWGDAFENIGGMIKFIEQGYQPGAERCGNEALGALEKAIDRQTDQSKRDKLRDTVTAVREALGHVRKEEWSYADSAAKRAMKLIEEAR